jgi:serine/threonine protein kinase
VSDILTPDATFSPYRALKVEAARARFEAGLRSGVPRLIDAYPGEAAGREQAELRKMIVLDVDCRRRQRERPNAREYQDRLPSLEERAEKNTASGRPVPPQGDATATAFPDEAAGTRIGPYKLLQKIGEGGMGIVWMADQIEPVKRRVALKMIKAGLEGDQVVARFEAERQTLAMMDHPNIIKVLDAGTAGSRRPYFVMELVNGIPFTRYCDQEHLTPAERLALFIPICHAVQHAHQNGIIHRDLKPSNILIALYDGEAVPKVIDFGLAKAIQKRLTECTSFTEVGRIVGTPGYMAPEQAGISAINIDTRADIYSLGAILYELLTGLRPFDANRLRRAALDELIRIIREEEPSKPSTRLSSDQALPSVAARRHTEPKRLVALMRGELDCIVMKALEKDRRRRYETAIGFARDVQRYLADEPVEAQPPSMGYRLGKFLKRNKGPVLATGTALLMLVLGFICGTAGIMRQEAAGASPPGEQAE